MYAPGLTPTAEVGGGMEESHRGRGGGLVRMEESLKTARTGLAQDLGLPAAVELLV